MNSKTLLSVSLLLAVLSVTGAVDYPVTNNAGGTAGGVRFENEIGVVFTQDIAGKATDFIWTTFRETSPEDRKGTTVVGIFIDDMDGVAYTSNDQIHFSARYIGGYTGDLKTEFAGVMYHEMTHVWQWNGNGQTPGGLIEGIADFVRLKAGYAPSHWVKPGEGDRWDQGYDVTARFLDYCEGLMQGFVAELNKKMRTGYSADYFNQLLGKSVDQLWADYKAAFPQT
ncbi:hypothetical protein MLD38_026693 [Melastoma candidum]|uniref:Uncharacterized protein n=1 Tax=Melastoma candidum TaxID=119954 RepID=A0ACB9P4C9_9MYRT|nr:hypothetical protein MLD38_026693 [Melastoma candidum]